MAEDIVYDVSIAAAIRLEAAFLAHSIKRHETVNRLLDALRSGDAELLRKVVLQHRRELLQHMRLSVDVAFWGYPTPYGVCPVIIDTLLSDASADRFGSKQFNFTLDLTEPWYSQLNDVLVTPEVAELCALLKSGLIPFGSASDFGEEERKAAFEHPLCWWELRRPTSSVRPGTITPDMCENFCGLPGYTKNSYMMRVVQRSKLVNWQAAAPHFHIVMHTQLAFLAQCFPSYMASLPIGARANGRLVFTGKEVSPNYVYPTVHLSLDYNHEICFWLIVGLLVLDSMYAHTRMACNSLLVDAPICIGGGGSMGNPSGRVTVNPNCNTVITVRAQ